MFNFNHNQNLSEPSSPLTFTYTHRSVSFHEDSSSCISAPQAYRINQLRPKAKLIISHCSTMAHSQHQPQDSSAKEHRQHKISIESPRRRQSLVESLSYSTIRTEPKMNWKRFSILCGVDTAVLGQSGCLCAEPCPWKYEWTLHKGKNDLSTFKSILAQQPEEQNLLQIEKDLPRTYPECPTFSHNPDFRKMLRNVLVGYSIYDMEMGYVQGLNMIAGVLLYHIKNAEQTFWALVDMMQDQELRMVYLSGFEQLRVHTTSIVSTIELRMPDLHATMAELDIIPESFINGWLLSLMSTCIPIQYMPEVVDRFRKTGWKFIYQLIVAYLLFLKQKLLLSSDQSEFLENVSNQAGRELGFEWNQIIKSSHKLAL